LNRLGATSQSRRPCQAAHCGHQASLGVGQARRLSGSRSQTERPPRLIHLAHSQLHDQRAGACRSWAYVLFENRGPAEKAPASCCNEDCFFESECVKRIIFTLTSQYFSSNPCGELLVCIIGPQSSCRGVPGSASLAPIES